MRAKQECDLNKHRSIVCRCDANFNRRIDVADSTLEPYTVAKTYLLIYLFAVFAYLRICIFIYLFIYLLTYFLLYLLIDIFTYLLFHLFTDFFKVHFFTCLLKFTYLHVRLFTYLLSY